MSAAMPPGLPSVILIGGSAGALSIARSLRPRGVRVYAIAPRTSHLRFSRHSQWIPLPKAEDRQTQWLDFLMQRAGEELRGAVVIPCEDDGLELVARRRSDLERRYVLIEANDAVLLALLDKEATYALAREAGVPAPRIWPVRSVEEAASLRDLTYPCAVKPRHSHRFQRHFPFHKLLVTRNRDGLLDALQLVYGRGLEVFIRFGSFRTGAGSGPITCPIGIPMSSRSGCSSCAGPGTAAWPTWSSSRIRATASSS